MPVNGKEKYVMWFDIRDGVLKKFIEEPDIDGITVPDGVTSIGDFAFHNCANLRSVTLPESAERIDAYAFDGCVNLEEVIAPGAISISWWAFNNHCEKVNTIIAPLKKASTFNGPQMKLAALRGWFNNPDLFDAGEVAEDNKRYLLLQAPRTLPVVFEDDSVYGISVFAESGRINDKNFQKKFLEPAGKVNAVKCVAYLLEWHAKQAAELSADNELKLRIDAASGPEEINKMWKYSVVGGELIINGYKGKELDIVVPLRIGEVAVSRIAKNAFKDCRGLRSVEIQYGVKSIGDSAFTRCSGLTSVKLPNSLETIEYYAFNNCRNLIDINIPDGVKIIEGDAFRWCDKLKSVTLPDGLMKIGSFAFDCCTALESITVPESVTEIGSWAFGTCFLHGERSCNCPNLTVYAPAGSYAEEYARSQRIPFKAI